MLIGERLNVGKSLYREIWTNASPLSAYFFGLVHFLFDRSQFFYELVSFFLVFFQALLFTLFVNKNKVFVERNYLPGLFYALVLSLSFDANKLSPALLATTFLLLAVNSLFKHIDNNDGSSEPIFEIGLFLGLGSLFFYPFPVFLVWALLSLVMFTPVKFKQILLLLLGFGLPVIVVFLFIYFIGSFEFFYFQWLKKGLSFQLFSSAELYEIAIIYALPLIIAVLGLVKVFSSNRYSNFQNRKQQIMVLLGIFALVCFFLSGDTGSYQLICISPFLAFFLTGWFIHLKGTWFPEIVFFCFTAAVVIINSQGYNAFVGDGYVHLSESRIEKTTDKPFIRDKFILITGSKNDDYFQAKSGSAYLNWEVSRYDLENPNFYERLISIHTQFKKEKPEFIIDKATVFPEIFRRIPELGEQYERIEGTRNFRLKE